MISRTSICSSVVATLATLVLISPSAAQACAQPVGKHCYSIIRSEHQYEGTWVDMVTSADNVTGWNKGDYVQDETWASFPGGGWVEVGDTTGAVDWGATPTPVYFYAGEYPANEKNYYEGAFSTGPSIEQWFWVQEQDEGNGTWCVWIDGGETQCVAGRPLYTSEVEAGLEAAVDYPVTNDGTGFAWAMNPGGAWSSWAPEKFIFNGNYCIYGVPWNPNSGLGDPGGSGLAGSGLVFSTPTNNPYCNKKSQTLASPVEDGVDGLTIATEPAKPVAAGYTLANGPTLSDGQLQEIAREVAKNASDEEAASGTLQAVETTLKTALSAIEPTTVFPSSLESGYANLLQSSTELVVMHGHFTLTRAHVPSGKTAPVGSVLEVIIDTHTGWVDGLRVGERAATGLSQYGAVTNLNTSA